ncbi:MAG: exodeoxyribonuclease VII small subunit [Lentisphaerae bacterium]|nr:exodeoxyribonuclease VII small subunit [Lentisphaerota bacterium]
MAAEKKEKAQSFEKALARLEEIAAAMESGDLGLEKMVEAFEEGQKLVKLCSSRLNEVEKKIEMLVKKADGSVEAEPFGDGAETDGSPF